MPPLIDQAVVLRLSDYSETSQIATLFSRGNGLVRLIAKGARRPTRSRPSIGLDLLESGEALFVLAKGEAGLGTLTDWKQQQLFLELRTNPVRLYGGLYSAELLLATMQENDPHPDAFDAVFSLLIELSDPASPPPNNAAIAKVVRFQADLLRSIGYLPNLRQCVGCGRTRSRGQPAWFSSRAGGLLCAKCQDRYPDKHELRAALLDGPRGTTPPEEWFALLDYHLTEVSARPFLAAKCLREALATGGGHL
ncbi:MAG: DNA repair protein RecO [Planctomycetes bacterium]|nr:DNA repair protein RecO [Planctomycetota bacterium]